MNSMMLDKTQPEIAEAVAGCEVGVPKKFTLTATPIADNDQVLVCKIDSVEYAEEAEGAEETEEMPAKSTETPYKPKARNKPGMMM